MFKNWNLGCRESSGPTCCGNTFHSDLQQVSYGWCGVTPRCVYEGRGGKPVPHHLIKIFFFWAWSHPAKTRIKEYTSGHQQVNSAKLFLVNSLWVNGFPRFSKNILKGKANQHTVTSDCGVYFGSKHIFTARKLNSWNQKQMEKWTRKTCVLFSSIAKNVNFLLLLVTSLCLRICSSTAYWKE